MYSKQKKSLFRRDVCTLMLTVALLTIVKVWQQPKSTNEWIKKMCVCVCTQIHTYKYRQTHTRDIIQPQKEGNPITCDNMMNLEGTMLNEISMREKNKYCTIYLYYVESLKKKKKFKLIETENRKVVVRA